VSLFRRRQRTGDTGPGTAEDTADLARAGTDDDEVADGQPHDEAAGDEPADAAGEGHARGGPARPHGPWDISEVDDPAERGLVDLGGLWVPVVEGLELRVEADEENGSVIAVTLVLEDSGLQLQPFAAPRSEGIWAQIRPEIAAGVTQQGGTADEVEGPLGPEVRAKVPVRHPDGSTGVEPARFLGVDGPRWFVRGVLTGRAAVEPAAGEALLELFRQLVVVRGTTAMAPRDAIPLRLPVELAPTVADDAEDAGRRPRLEPFERGPEITEIR
jgi:hypothetical protein